MKVRITLPFSHQRSFGLVAILLFFSLVTPLLGESASSVTQYGITWTFDKSYPVGQFCTGDYWVVGPIKIIGISTDLHTSGYAPEPGQDGSMVNPGTTDKQGYDNRLKSSYDPSLNAGLIGGKVISPQNPLVLGPDSSLVSMVSWLYKSEQEKEPGTPKFANYSQAPRSATRSAAVLTVLKAPAPQGSFRPPYCGSDKVIKYNVSQLDLSKLKNLPPPPKTPSPDELAAKMERPWIDHVNQFLGADIHPTENMPNYGREIADILSNAGLLLNLDFSQLPGKPTKDKLLMRYVQFAVDCTGIADNGGGWPNNGGHEVGRKLPIMIAGIVLNDQHMKDVGNWKTEFQEDEQTFYVRDVDVQVTHSDKWKPDKRANTPIPYETADIGLAEWSCVYVGPPDTYGQGQNANWDTPYRGMNSAIYPGIVLTARIMGMEDAWNHKALFDYTDRWFKKYGGHQGYSITPDFIIDLWKQYENKQLKLQ